MDQERKQAPTTNSNQETGTGYLIVQVSTARGAIPLEGARVDIRTYESENGSSPSTRGDVVASLISGRDGNTIRLPLSAPPKAASAAPGNGRPYALYQAEVSMEGYYNQTYIGIPIFDGITAIQPAVLIPLSENGTTGIPRPDDTSFFENPPSNL